MRDLQPFFSYYGGKWRAAPLYPEPGPVIVEPFAGSAGYATRYPDRRAILLDADPVIAGTWAYLIRVSEVEILSLPDVPMGGRVSDVAWPCEEAGWLAGWWLSRATSGPRVSPSAWMRGGLRPRLFWGPAARERIASQLARIRHWTIIHGDYRQAPDIEATWFVDPPYQVMGKHYRHGAKGLDFDALGAWCRERKGQAIVCENEGATWLPFEPFARVKATERAGGGRVSAEAVWLSACPDLSQPRAPVTAGR